jgi:hypothetical protein
MFQAGGDGPGADHKVPSRYSYTPALHHAQWGSDIADNSDVLQWTKLTLDPQTVLAHLKQLRDLATFLHSKSDLFNEAVPVWQRNEHKNIRKSPTDVVGDYIHKLIEFWAEKVERDRAYVLDENHIDVVVTHPAVSNIGS